MSQHPTYLRAPPASFWKRTFWHQRGFLIWFLITQGFIFIFFILFYFCSSVFK